MKSCPYCFAEIHVQAVICAQCGQHLTLVEALGKQVAALQARLDRLGEQTVAESAGSSGVDTPLPTATTVEPAEEKAFTPFGQLLVILLVPLGLLLIAHILLAFVYDTRLIYQRLIAMVLPLPFGLLVRSHVGRHRLLWALAAAVLGGAAVLGMSAINAWVDNTPVWPQGMVEWRDAFEFSASIALSFVTGMLLRRNLDSAMLRTLPNASSTGVKVATGYGFQQLTRAVEALQPLVSGAVAIYAGLKVLFS